jgi:hypothetical protein
MREVLQAFALECSLDSATVERAWGLWIQAQNCLCPDVSVRRQLHFVFVVLDVW